VLKEKKKGGGKGERKGNVRERTIHKRDGHKMSLSVKRSKHCRKPTIGEGAKKITRIIREEPCPDRPQVKKVAGRKRVGG